MLALFAAAGQCCIDRFVQISAPRAAPDASTQFMPTKDQADEPLTQSLLEWTILRPGLLLSPQAYGDNALLRALAAVPFVLPVTFGTSPVQTVAASDIAKAVEAVLEQQVPKRRLSPSRYPACGWRAAPAAHGPRGWIVLSLGLYVLTGLFWLPVV